MSDDANSLDQDFDDSVSVGGFIGDALPRAEVRAPAAVGWDAEPASRTSTDFGSRWARDNQTLLLIVPSAIVREESNVLVNPRHADAGRITARKILKWLYDPRPGRRA